MVWLDRQRRVYYFVGEFRKVDLLAAKKACVDRPRAGPDHGEAEAQARGSDVRPTGVGVRERNPGLNYSDHNTREWRE